MSARRLAKLLGTFHNVSYYAPEMQAFADLGLPEYWRAYFAYRSAPMGMVAAPVVQATFYNFAPSRVGAAIPSAWTAATPAEVLALRDRCVSAALRRSLEPLGPSVDQRAQEAAALALPAVIDCDAGARPLYAGHRELEIPDDPLLRLWFAATLWREYRGDGHNLALAAADIDGIECHVLLAGRGVADKDIIGKIRGWSATEWDLAHERLEARGLVGPTGEATPNGAQLRSDIEDRTDALMARPMGLLESGGGVERLADLVEPLVAQLIGSGLVPGRWPPPQAPGSVPPQAPQAVPLEHEAPQPSSAEPPSPGVSPTVSSGAEPSSRDAS